MRTKIMHLLAMSALISACTIGQSAEEWGVAGAPAGANATIVTHSTTTKGELIEVNKDGIVMLRSDHTLVFAPFAAIGGIEVPGVGSAYGVNGTMPMSAERKAKLSMLSHFPQGMPAAARDQLLAASGQKEMTVIE